MGAPYVVADATEPEKFEPAVQAADEIDLVVHASGILGGTYARKQTFEQWRGAGGGEVGGNSGLVFRRPLGRAAEDEGRLAFCFHLVIGRARADARSHRIL